MEAVYFRDDGSFRSRMGRRMKRQAGAGKLTAERRAPVLVHARCSMNAGARAIAWATPSIDGTRSLFVFPSLFARCPMLNQKEIKGTPRGLTPCKSENAETRLPPHRIAPRHATANERRHPMTKRYLYFHSEHRHALGTFFHSSLHAIT